jgi:hypothetical protein
LVLKIKNMLHFALWPFSGSASTLSRLCKHFSEKVQALLFFLSAAKVLLLPESLRTLFASANAAIERGQTQTRLQYAEREQGLR